VVFQATQRFREERPDAEVLLLGAEESLRGAPPGFETLSVGSFDGTLASAGQISVAAIRRGVEVALSGQAAGLVTGPVHKPALHAAGERLPGQTELLQALTGAASVGMLMCAERTRLGPPLRILLATTHLPLREVPDRLTIELIESQIRLLHEELRSGWGIAAPRIVVCALNPHASDGGLFGDEEARLFTPAIARARAAGIEVAGPLPADTAFLTMTEAAVEARTERRADAIVSPYHDVGMAVFKTLAFGKGVNVTLGLPFPRTSPDHGTAFDLAGTGRADSSSTLEAFRLAARIVEGRRRAGSF
jgi:4-hydroxythreonine-4-phosphate dehydrogenase